MSRPVRTILTYLKQQMPLLPLTLWALILVIPILALVTVAFKTRYELLFNPLGWPHHFQWDNFTNAWNQAHLGNAIVTSILITGGAIVGLIILGASAAYPLARRTGRIFNAIFLFFITGLVIPVQLGLIPLYQLWHTLGLTNTLLGVILIYIGSTLPLVIFLYVGFIKTVPRELEEAAAIDGASRFHIFWRVIFPLLSPVTATVTIVSSVFIWNDFLVPLLFLQDSGNQTIPLAIFGFVGQYSQDWPLIFASIIMSSLPIIIVFLLLQRSFIKGLSGGALAN